LGLFVFWKVFMLQRLLLTLVTAIALACAAPGAEAADVVYPGSSRIGLVPPQGMQPATRFSGFDEAGSANVVLLSELPKDAYQELSTTLATKVLESSGLKLIQKGKLKEVRSDNVYVIAEEKAGAATVRRYMLLTRGDDLTGLVTIQVPQGEKTTIPEATIKKVLASYSVRPPLSAAQQLAALPFKIADLNGFRFVRSFAGNAALLTEGPKDTVRSVEQPTVVVASAFSAIPANERESFGKRALAGLPQLKDTRIETDDLAGSGDAQVSTVVATARSTEDGDLMIVFQSVHFNKDGYIRVVAMGKAVARDALLPRFQKLRDGVSRR
jgi:hypothetical protein